MRLSRIHEKQCGVFFIYRFLLVQANGIINLFSTLSFCYVFLRPSDFSRASFVETEMKRDTEEQLLVDNFIVKRSYAVPATAIFSKTQIMDHSLEKSNL